MIENCEQSPLFDATSSISILFVNLLLVYSPHQNTIPKWLVLFSRWSGTLYANWLFSRPLGGL